MHSCFDLSCNAEVLEQALVLNGHEKDGFFVNCPFVVALAYPMAWSIGLTAAMICEKSRRCFVAKRAFASVLKI